MNEAGNPWSELASRIVRVALTRKNISYIELSERLATIGVTESANALASRISRGRIKVQFFLQVLAVSGGRIPRLWIEAIPQRNMPWEEQTRLLVTAEFGRQPTVPMLSALRRAEQLGASVSAASLEAHLQSGSISLPDLLILLVVLGSPSLDLYIDFGDLADAARDTSII